MSEQNSVLKTDAMEEESSVQLPFSLLANCKLTISDKIPCDGKLLALITDTLKFKIITMFPIVIEKDDPSPDDINKLLDALKSHNRKVDKLVKHQSHSSELKQREGNVACESLIETSSLGEEHENRQLTEKTKRNLCDNSRCEVYSHQAQGSNDDVHDLANSLQNLSLNHVSNDNDQEHNQFENTLREYATFQKLTNTPLELENENKALMENATDAEKQENNSQGIREDKKQVETTQTEYLRKQVETTQPEYLRKQVETTQPEYPRKQVETTQPEYPRKQVETTQPEYPRKQVETTQPEYLGQQVETTQPEYPRKQVETTQPEYPRKQVETTQPEYPRKQVETTQPEYPRKHVKTTQPEYLGQQVETTHPEYLRKQVETTQPEYPRKQVETTQTEYLRKHVETTQPEYPRKQVETTQPECPRKQVETTQPEYPRKQVETTQSEYPRKQVETTQPEYPRKHVKTTQPEYLGQQVETTQPEYPRKQVETTQTEYLRKHVETTQPEYPRKQVETTQPECPRKQVETTQPEYPRKQVETTQSEYPRKQVETTQPEYPRKQVETTQSEYPRKQVETTQSEYPRTQVEATQPEYLRKQVETTQTEYPRKQVETTQSEYPRKQVETTQSEYPKKQVETTQSEYPRKQVETTQPEYPRKQVETTQPEYLRKQVETTQPEYPRKQVETTQPEYPRKQVETTQPEYPRKQVETTQPEYPRKQVETTQPEYPRKQVETTQPEYPRKQVETTQPEYLRKQVETTQPEYPRKQVETTQPEYPRKQVETTQPEYPRKQVETTQPEYPRKQVETTQPEYPRKQVETTHPEYLRKQVETTHPEYLRKQVETTHPECPRKQVETTQPEYPRKQVETTHPEYLRKQVETTHPEYLRKQVETTHPECPRKQVETTQPEYPRKLDKVAKHSTADVQVMPNTTVAKENELNHKQKELSRDMEHSGTNEKTFSTDIQKIDVTHTKFIAGQKNNSIQAANTSRQNKQLNEKDDDCENISVEESYRKTTGYMQCGEHAEATYKQIPESSVTPREESLSKQDNLTHPSSLECGRQGQIDQYVHRQDVQTIKENHGTNTGTDIKNASEMRPIVSEDANINKGIKMQIYVDDKNENHVTSSDIVYSSETREDHACHSSSVQNVNPSPMNDIASQEHLRQRKDSANADMQISLKDGGSKNMSFKQRELETSKISSRSHEIQDNTDSSDSDAEFENVIIYSIKASLIDDIRMYFNEKIYDEYFEDAKKEGKNVIFKLKTCNDGDVLFLDTLKQLKVEECEFDHKDIQFNSAVQDIQSQTGALIIQINDNQVHIVGLKASVTSAKKRLQLLLQNHDPKNSQNQDMAAVDKSTATRTESLDKNNPDTRNQETSRKNSDDEITNKLRRPQKSEFTEMQQTVPELPTSVHNFHCHSSSLPEDSYPEHKAGKKTYSGNSEHCSFSKGHNIYYAGNERSKLKVQILKADITKLEVDCIVNAANKRLQHYGGVAKAISSAAGPALKKECEDFIQSGNQVAEADIFVSTGGKMPAKYVIHAVGPKWESYDDNSKSQCLQNLRHTVIRCLVEADRRGFTSIALPSISAAIFKVPKEACAGCYMKAVKHFGILFGEQTSLRDIRFVDVDETMVTVIQQHFQRNWTKPCEYHIVQEDGEFAKAHVFSATRNAAKNTEKLPDKYKLTSSSSSVSAKASGASKSSSVVEDRSWFGSTVASRSDLREERNSVYQIGKFTLYTDTRPALNHSADITITVGKPFDKLSGLHDFSVSSNMNKKEGLKNTFKVFTASKPKGKQEKLVCALLPEPDDAHTIKKAIGNLSTIIQSPNKNIFMQNIKKVVLTSSILYDEPSNTQKKGNKHTFDRKKVGDFARCLFDYLDHPSGITAPSISITVVGNEEALQSIHKVLESRNVKKISPKGAKSMARDPSPYRQIGNSGQYPGSAAPSTHYAKQHGEEGAKSMARDPSPYRQIGNSGQYPGSAAPSTHYAKQHGEEGAKSMARGPSPYRQIGNSGQYPGSAAPSTHYAKQHGEEDIGSSVDSEKVCEICAWKKPVYAVRCCGKYLCQTCEQKMPNCPYCRKFWRVFIGDQPPGTMTVFTIHDYAEGYESTRAWEINYSFPSGSQTAYHPNPGQTYRGMSRKAFLPMNRDGMHVLKLLRLAFLRKLTFTIGRSLTTDRENSIVWNDIHHKTCLHGGSHGYPDSNYLFNITQELASKGVTLDTMSEDEKNELVRFEWQIVNVGHFSEIHPR